MLNKENIDITGKLIIRKYSLGHKLIQERRTYNEITIAGRQHVARLFNRNLISEKKENIERISTIGLGASNIKFDPQQENLVDPIGYIDINTIEEVPIGDRIMLRMVGELDEKTCNGTLREAGLFTKGSEPIMYNRVVFDTITKTEQFKLTLLWEITF